jgi:DNA-directed RNA polymerase specialized sigma24 family protein
VRFHEGDASPHDDHAPDGAGDPPVAQVIALHPPTGTAILAMLSHPQTRREVTRIVAAKVPPACVADLVQDALVKALKAADRSPPAHEDRLPGWVATITRRVVADFLAQRARRARYDGDLPDEPEDEPGAPDGAAGVEASADDEPLGFPEPSYDPRAAEDEEGRVDAWLVRQWLEKQVAADPRDRETFAILLEHAQGGRTYRDIARARGTTLTALSSRIFEFKGRYLPRYRRWRSRAVLLLLLGGAAIVVEIVILLWLLRAPRGPLIGPDPYRPVPVAPSATVVAPPPFDQALPPTRRPVPDRPWPNDKQPPPKR